MADLASQPTSIQSVYGWYAANKLYVNRRYQRKLVWTQLEKQKLVESILKKYPIPAILVAEREAEPGTYEIIDGLQRLHAIISFIEGSFPTVDGELFATGEFPTAKNRRDEGTFTPIPGSSFISSKNVSTILDYTLALSVMRNATDVEVDDVFDRINTYGHRLSDQERRQAGVQNEFSNMVRVLASTLRGDESTPVLPLSAMPSISIDLPMTKHGYSVQADEVFWVNQGILRATDLRDSMDEQCIADVTASIVNGEVIERSKDALDQIYMRESKDSEKILAALEVYGSNRLVDEFKFCVDEILEVCRAKTPDKLREVIFPQKNTNAFPAVFAVILLAFHELIVKEKKQIADYLGVKRAITDLVSRIETSRRATSPDERRKNINTIKGLVSACFIDGDQATKIYENHTAIDIESSIRRSEIELANFELKQGIVTLGPKREIDESTITKILKTICAIANNGRERTGKIIIGVTDKDADAVRIEEFDAIKPRKVGKRFVVGVTREAKFLGKSVEDYVILIRDRLKQSKLSEPLKSSVLAHVDYNSFYGMGVIVITIPKQDDMSYFDNEAYRRDADTTIHVTSAVEIGQLAKRF